MQLENCAMCGGGPMWLAGNGGAVCCQGCNCYGPSNDHDGEKWNQQQRWTRAGKAAETQPEPTLGQTIIGRLSDFERQLAALRSDVHDKALHGIGAIGLRVTTLESQIQTCLMSCGRLSDSVDALEKKFPREEVLEEPYIPFRDEVYIAEEYTTLSQDMEVIERSGKQYWSWGPKDDDTVNEFVGKADICTVRDLRERHSPASNTRSGTLMCRRNSGRRLREPNRSPRSEPLPPR